jgi:peptidyl-prolyl cis-trans isomerase SurA
MKIRLPKIILYAMAVFGLLCPLAAGGAILERIVALVNNEVITLSELEEAGRRFFEEVKKSSFPAEREAKLSKAREEVLGQLIENKLLEQEIKSKKIEVPERDVDAAIKEIMEQNRLTENDLKRSLAQNRVTFSVYRQHIRENLGKMRLINREIKSKIVIKEEDLRKVYKENVKEYTEPSEVKVQQIFFPTPQGAVEREILAIREEAQSILERARKGEDFAELARNYSKGPEASGGGVLGFFKPKEMRPELEEVVFKLKPGEISDPVKSMDGFHILRVPERKGGEPRPFVEVQNRIRDEMMQVEAERQFQEWMKALKAKAYIEIKL